MLEVRATLRAFFFFLRFSMLRFAQGCMMAALAGTMFGTEGLLEGIGHGGRALMTLFLVIVLVLLTPSLFPDRASRQPNS